MRKIPLERKITKANTTYYNMHKDDKKFILDQCKTLVEVDDMMKNDDDLKDISQELNTPDRTMTRKSNRQPNSPRSMCEGVYDNITNPNIPQRDFSEPQIDGLEKAFKCAVDNEIPGIEEVVFEKVLKLPTKPASTQPIEKTTTFNDLFEINITVSVKKK